MRDRGTCPFSGPGSQNTTSGQNPAAGKPNEWRDYFFTHAPAEWWFNAATRKQFAELYGERALTTLDWTGTIPENIDPVFVTHVPLDESGKPIPRALLT